MRMSNTVQIPTPSQGGTKQPLLIAPYHHHHHLPDGDGDGYMSSSRYINKSLALLASSSPKMKKFKYMECLKNHAAAIGGSATDGCGEFMPAGEEGSIEALKCEACHCHRNFHRKKIIIPQLQPQPEPHHISGHGRKRPRSKFSQDQKEKMQRFAEKAGWKMHNADAEELRSFCEEIGVNTKVLKVWMHNNKYNHHLPNPLPTLP